MKLSRMFAVFVIAGFVAQASAVDERYSDAKCERIDARLDKINSQLRTGARAKKGERLKDRRRELKLERSQHCNP